MVGDDVVFEDNNPAAAPEAPPEEARFVESNNNPLREEPEVFALEPEIGGAGGFVSVLRFLPNFFFFVVESDGPPRRLEVILHSFITAANPRSSGDLRKDRGNCHSVYRMISETGQ